MNQEVPFVSICTPTFNRRPFIENMFQCFRNQTYPKNRMEWIIVDDGTDKIKDLINDAKIEQIKYFAIDKKMTLGEKRNFIHDKTCGSILVYMDDDDYYPPERVQHAVDILNENPTALCAGSSELYIYYKDLGKMYQSGPFGPTHATAGTFAMRKALLQYCKYDQEASLAEERSFLKGYTIPFAQLDPLKTILVFSHNHNSFDKKNMLKETNNQYFKESSKKVTDFIRKKKEKSIYDFFMKHIDKKLQSYDAGKPENKPDVLQQIKEIDAERQKLEKESKKNGSIMVEVPGQGKRSLQPEEIVHILTQQQNQIKFLINRVKELEDKLLQMQMNEQCGFQVSHGI